METPRPPISDDLRCTYIIPRTLSRCQCRKQKQDPLRCARHTIRALEERARAQRERLEARAIRVQEERARAQEARAIRLQERMSARANMRMIAGADSDSDSDSDDTVLYHYIRGRRGVVDSESESPPRRRHLDNAALPPRPLVISSTGCVACICCFDEFPKDEMMICNSDTRPHAICIDCFRAYNISELNSARASQCCMAESADHCGGTFTVADIKRVLTPDQWARYCSTQEVNAVAAMTGKVRNYYACPQCCKFGYIIDNPKTTHGYCPRCDKSWCIICNQPHAGSNCYLIENPETIAYDTLYAIVSRIITIETSHKCPQCNTYAIKSEGCNHITCPCGTHYCYVCGEDISRYRSKMDHFGTSLGKCSLNTNKSADELNAKYTTAVSNLLKENTTPRIYDMIVACVQALLPNEIKSGKVDVFAHTT